MVSPRYGGDGAPYREGFCKNFEHKREALLRQFPQAGEDLPGCGVHTKRDREQQVKKVHRSVLVDSDKSDTR